MRWRIVVLIVFAILVVIGMAMANLVLDEDFSEGTMPTDWTTVDNNSDGISWTVVNSVGCLDPLSCNLMIYPVVAADSDCNHVGYDDELRIPSLDLSGCINSILRFTHDFQSNDANDNAYVKISTNGGATWTEIASWEGIDNSCSNHEYDISAIADGESNVIISFHYVTVGTWEWWWAIDNVQVEALCAGTGVGINPTSSSLLGDPGKTVEHTFTIQNMTGSSGTATISYSGNEWKVSGPTKVGPIAEGDTKNFNVKITIPKDFQKYSDTTAVTVSLNGYNTSATAKTAIAWESRSPLPNPRGDHAVAYWDKKLFAVGGWGDYELPLNDLQLYDMVSDFWSAGTALSQRVFMISATAIGGMVYIPGGFNSADGTSLVDDYNLYIYDISEDTWTTGKSVPEGSPTVGYAVCTDGQYLYRLGGTNYDNWPAGMDKFLKYDPETDSWEELASLPSGRRHVAAGYIHGKIYLVGGLDPSENATSDIFIYDVETNFWEITKAANYPGTIWGAAYGVAIDKLYVAGGLFNESQANKCFFYDPEETIWGECTDLPDGAYRTAGVASKYGFYVAGGYSLASKGHEHVYSLPVVGGELPFDDDIDDDIDDDLDDDITGDDDEDGGGCGCGF